MILVGQYDSPFVRRVAVALHLYGLPFERRALSVFRDFDAVLAISPLGKVPVLLLNDGEPLFDSRAILDHLDSLVGPDARLLPKAEPDRRSVLRAEAVALGLCEKLYEHGVELGRRAPGRQDPAMLERAERQIRSALGWLEALRPAPWLVGGRFTRADATAAIALTYLREKSAGVVDPAEVPALRALCDRCEATEPFRRAAYSAVEAARSGWRPSGGGAEERCDG